MDDARTRKASPRHVLGASRAFACVRPAALGVGLGYRPAIRKEILQHLGRIDFLEILTDNYLRDPIAVKALASLKPCIPHSLNLSVGSAVDLDYLAHVAQIVDLAQPAWHSDHLAYTRTPGLDIGHLAPVPYTPESLDTVVANIRLVQKAIERPFALENITMPFYWPTSTMEEHEFLSEVVRRTGCHLLLDIENVRVNHANHARAARDLLDRLPLESVIQVHIAGGTHADGLEHDTHTEPVSEATWSLLEYLVEVAPPPSVLIERDGNFPPFGELLAEVDRAKSILSARAAA